MSQVFVFSACWRTGSTLLQRFLNTSEDLLIWGEPNFLMPLNSSYIKSKGHFESVQWQKETVKKEGFKKAWSPVLCPDVDSLKDGYRAFFETTYSKELADHGKTRWGFKEVRQNAYAHAVMMKELFPDSKIIFHYRNPYDVYESLLGTDFHKNFKAPLQPIRFWANNMADFVDAEKISQLDAMLISHEKFVSGRNSESLMHQVCDFANIELTKDMIDVCRHKVGGTSTNKGLDRKVKDRIDKVISEVVSENQYWLIMSLLDEANV